MALLPPTSESTTAVTPLPPALFHGTTVAGTRNLVRWTPLSCNNLSSLDFWSPNEDDDDDPLADTPADTTVRLRPRKGTKSSKKNAFISTNKLFKAWTENNARILPLAPDVRINDGDDDVAAFGDCTIAIDYKFLDNNQCPMKS